MSWHASSMTMFSAAFADRTLGAGNRKHECSAGEIVRAAAARIGGFDRNTLALEPIDVREEQAVWLWCFFATDLNAEVDGPLGAPDAFAVVFANGVEVGRTAVVEDSASPSWDGACFELALPPVPELLTQFEVRVELWDKNTFGADDFLGQAVCTGWEALGALSQSVEGPHLCPLRPHPGRSARFVQGSLAWCVTRSNATEPPRTPLPPRSTAPVPETLTEQAVDKVVAALAAHDIQHGWQLRELDTSSWQMLGASLGLAAACRAMATESAAAPVLPSSAVPGADADTDAAVLPSKASGMAAAARKPRPGVLRQIGQLLATLPLRSPYQMWMPADHQQGFKECILTCRSNEHIQTYLSTVAEMWILMLGLEVGALVGMWSMVPKGADPKLQLVFEIMAGLATVLCLGVVAMNSVIFLMVQSIGVANIKIWMASQLPSMQLMELALMCCLYATYCVVGLLGWMRVGPVAKAIDEGLELPCQIVFAVLVLVVMQVVLCVIHPLVRSVMFGGLLAERRIKTVGGKPVAGVDRASRPELTRQFAWDVNSKYHDLEEILMRYGDQSCTALRSRKQRASGPRAAAAQVAPTAS